MLYTIYNECLTKEEGFCTFLSSRDFVVYTILRFFYYASRCLV